MEGYAPVLILCQKLIYLKIAVFRLHHALDISHGVDRIQLKVIADIAKLQIHVKKAYAITLAGQLRCHVDTYQGLAYSRGCTEKSNDHAIY